MFVIRHPDDGHRSNRITLMKNNDNMWLNIFVKVYLLVYDIYVKKVGYAFIMTEKCGHRIVQE